MTAFNQVLNAEQEAEQSIKAATEEVAATVAEARAERQTRLKNEAEKLREIKEKTLSDHKLHIDEAVKKIQTDVATQVAAIEQRFISHKTELKSSLMQSFK